MPFKPVNPTFNLPNLEDSVLERWRAEDVFARSLKQREGAPQWVFYEGPPTANALPGTHHIWARVFKDLYPRFHTMRGKYVARKGGWDTHGLPVEIQVEKELGFSGKPDIEAYGIEPFNKLCRESVTRYIGDFERLTERIGMWIDTEDAYWTLSNDYIESVWWLLQQMWDKGLIYEGTKVVPYCGRCGTALSSHEVAQGYEDVTEDSVYVRFPVVGRDYDLLVWTTTPWTLISNVAAAVGPNVSYVRVQTDGRDVVMGASRVAAVFGEDAVIKEPVPTSELVGAHYQRPFETLLSSDNANRVIAADFVTVDDGSGIVHLAPAFGEIDREVCEADGNFPMLNPVNERARFGNTVPQFEDQFVKDADPAIIEDLKARNLLVRVEPYEHSYPHCWRCGTPLIYWAKPTWFARTSDHRDELLAQNETIGWHPDHIKHGRFGDWLENNVDWALSRDRYWGTPLPIWRCADCNTDHCFGSITELAAAAGRDLGDLELHRPYVDDVEVTCSACGGTARRITSVLDVWFDSGSMPSAQFHYPFANKETFDARFPADFICEAIDQTRGWFYSLLAVNTLVFGKTPYKNVLCLSHIVDKDGLKMSKTKGNVIDPWSILDAKGADALRWYFFSAGSPWIARRVSFESIDESTRRFLLTLWNTYSFFTTYANLDNWEPDPVQNLTAQHGSHVLDRWIQSRLHSTILSVTESLEEFDNLRAATALAQFVDDLSNWYVRRSRPRFWKAADGNAHATLHACLTTVSLLLAPFCPFVSDEIYRNLTHADSVHLADWPTADTSVIDLELEEEMHVARDVASLGRSARTKSKIKVRQPLPRAIALVDRDLSPEVIAEITDELNVKSFERVTGLEGLLDYTIVPNFRALGPKVGPKMPIVKEALLAANEAEVRQALEKTQAYTLQLPDGSSVNLTAEDVEVRAQSHEEFVLAQDGEHAVALDTTLTDVLRSEGLARELVRALNDHRKAIGLEIADRIKLQIEATGLAFESINEHQAWIAGEVLATEFAVRESEPISGAEVLEIDDHAIGVTLTK